MRTLEQIYQETFGENIPQDAYGQVAAEAMFSFSFFVEKILGFTKPYRLADFHKKDMNAVINSRYNLVIWPRGHLKTTIFTVGYVIWRLWRETKKEICIVSSAADQSQDMIQKIQLCIEDNEFLKHLMPEGRETTWNKSQLNTLTGNRCYMKPFNSSARGVHVDVLILDDILREENITQEQVKELFWSVFFPTTGTRAGQIIFVGTPQTARDLFADLQETGPSTGWNIIKRAAVNLDENGNWIEPIWSERFSLLELEQFKKLQGSLRFSREYMCSPKSGGTNIFKMKKIGDHPEQYKARAGYIYFMGIDVSMSGSKNADYLVFTIISKDRNGALKQVKQERYQGKDENFILKRTLELAEAFHPKKIGIEQIGISVGLVNMMINPSKFPRLSPIVEPIKMNRWGQKEEIISYLQSACETGTLTILDNPILIEEMDSFQLKEDDDGKITFQGVGNHDDCVMALAFAVFIASEALGRASFSVVGPGSAEETAKWLNEQIKENGPYAMLI